MMLLFCATACVVRLKCSLYSAEFKNNMLYKKRYARLRGVAVCGVVGNAAMACGITSAALGVSTACFAMECLGCAAFACADAERFHERIPASSSESS